MAEAAKPDLEAEAEEAKYLAELQEDHPGREMVRIEYAGQSMVVMKPTDGQSAALVRVLHSRRVDDTTAVSNVLDVLEALLPDEYDQRWLSDQLLGGEMEMAPKTEEELDGPEPTALGLLRLIVKSFGEPENRADRRQGKKARRGR